MPAGRVRGISFETKTAPAPRHRRNNNVVPVAGLLDGVEGDETKNSYAFVRSTAASFMSTYPQRARTPRSHADESRQRFETRATACMVL